MQALDPVAARINSLFTLVNFVNLVLMVASFSESDLGGHCEDVEVIPNIQILLYWIMIGVHAYVILEYFFGYGAVSFDDKASQEPQNKLFIILYQQMTSFFFRWSIFMILVKLGIIFMSTSWANKEGANVFQCDVYKWTLIYTNTKGVLYWFAFTIHNLLFVNMFNTIFFEGGFLVSLFGSVETPDWTMCMYCCTFCQWDYSTKI